MPRTSVIAHDGSDPKRHRLFDRAQETRIMNAAALEQHTNARHESMSELWRVNGPSLSRFALKLTLGDKHRAEDIIQETLVRAWRRPDVVDGRADLIKSWLFTVCRSVSIDIWRAQSRHNNYIVDDNLVDSPDPVD